MYIKTMTDIYVDIRGADELESKLKGLTKRGVRAAQNATMRTAAFETMRESKETMGRKMILRNKFLQNSIQVQKGDLWAEVGSRFKSGRKPDDESALRTQEFGGTRKPTKRANSVRITTTSATKEGENSKIRRKVAIGRARNVNIHGAKRYPVTKPKSKKHRTWLMVRTAVAEGNRFIYLRSHTGKRKKGIYRVTGGSKRTAFKEQGENIKLELFHDMTDKKYRIPKNQWLKPSTEKITKNINTYYQEALRFQIKRRTT